MKLTIDTKSFSEAIVWTTKNYDANNDNSHIVLEVNNKNEATLAYSTSTSYLKCSFQVLDSEIDKEEFTKNKIQIALEGKYLRQLAGVIAPMKTASTLTFDKESENTLELETAQSDFSIPTMDVSITRQPNITTIGEVDDREFFDSLQRMSKLCDPNNTAAVSSVDVRLLPEDKKVTMMATDSYILGEATVTFEPNDETQEYVDANPDVLLPMEAAALIAPAKNVSTTVSLAYSKVGNKFGYQFADGRIALFALKDADAIKYDPLKERNKKSVEHSFVFTVAELKKAIDMVSKVTWNQSKLIFTVNVEQSELIISDETDKNKVSVSIDNIDSDKDYVIHFMRGILAKAFIPVTTSKAKLNWKNENFAFTIDAVLDDGEISDDLFINVMPVKQ